MSYCFGLGIAETWATLLPTLAPLYLSWAAFHSGRGEASLAEIADEFARAVRGQWEAEVRMRRINDPYPLPVTWRPAPPELVEEWRVQRAMAQSWSTAAGMDSDSWAEDPEALAGAGGEIAEVFTRRVPTCRLVVLGEPGAGKSMLLRSWRAR